MDIFAFLAEHNITYERVDHPAVYTVPEAEKLVPPLPGASTKNLFLKTKSKSNPQHYLVVVGYDKRVDLKRLAVAVGEKKLSFASPERLLKYLGLTPGAVSILGIVNDVEGAVKVVIDQDVWQADAIKAHPLVNTSTLSIGREAVKQILNMTNHPFAVIEIPQR